MKTLFKAAKYIFFLIILLILSTVITFVFIKLDYKKTVKTNPQNLNTPFKPSALNGLVNPFIGTGGFPVYTAADNFPGPSMPFGMVRLSPDTHFFLRNSFINLSAIPILNFLVPGDNPVSTAGYYYGDKKIMGFSHTRLSGTGASDGGHFRVIPSVSEDACENYRKGRFNRFTHDNEVASPGYYAVHFTDKKILAELTASERAGVHRYTFSGGETPHILIDVAGTLKGRTEEGEVNINPEAQEITGAIKTFGSFSGRYGGLKVYFVAQFNQPFKNYSVWSEDKILANTKSTKGNQLGADISFNKAGEKLEVVLKLAISYVSLENARLNLVGETKKKSFEDVLYAAQKAWEDNLELIKVEGGTKEQQNIFYTALYHSLQMPTVFNDVNGDFIGFDKKIHTAKGFRYFTDLSLWDTFRTIHPLYTLIKPKDQRDMMISLVEMSKHGGGKLPRWPSGAGYTGSMLGASADIVISEAYQKGITDFDVETAYQAMRNVALDIELPNCDFNARRGAKEYLEFKYCPADLMDKAVSKTLEYAYADDAISKLATALGKKKDAILFHEHSQYYRNVWNHETQYFHARNSDGTFVENFDPLKLTYLDFSGKYTDDYVEGTALQWRWALFFDPEGLISLFESPKYFVNELNDFFALSDSTLGRWTPGSYYWHGNEPDIHAAYLFNTAGRPDLTQKWVRWILDNKYSADYFGIEGDDDAGTLSSWYVFSSLGLYPVAGSDIYQLGAPLFKKAEISLGENKLIIVAENFSPENKYANKVWLNGKLLNRTWFKHHEIANGGELRFEMSYQPICKQLN
ncbi:GH92 family glycosyl hydrolase [Draconibacterium sp.]|nr:GH92 family glycosyl hydrolase [Draconibacterium sp.]